MVRATDSGARRRAKDADMVKVPGFCWQAPNLHESKEGASREVGGGLLLAGALRAPPQELIPEDLSVRNHPNRLRGESDFSSEVIVRS